MIQHFSIKRNADDMFQVYFNGEAIVERVYYDEAMTQSDLIVDERTVHTSFSAAKQYIFDEEAEHAACEAERAQERYIAMNFDECGNRFRDGDEW